MNYHSLACRRFLQIFGQRVLYEQITRQFDFDPPLLSKEQVDYFSVLVKPHSDHSSFKNDDQIKEWLIDCRLNDYIQTDIYIESLLGLLLTRIDDVQS